MVATRIDKDGKINVDENFQRSNRIPGEKGNGIPFGCRKNGNLFLYLDNSKKTRNSPLIKLPAKTFRWQKVDISSPTNLKMQPVMYPSMYCLIPTICTGWGNLSIQHRKNFRTFSRISFSRKLHEEKAGQDDSYGTHHEIIYRKFWEKVRSFWPDFLFEVYTHLLN